MRKVYLVANAEMPIMPRYWFRITDRLQHDWALMNRKKLSGRVRVSLVWHDKVKHSYLEEAQAAVELISRLGFILAENAQPFIGQSRSELGYPRLRVTLEGE